MHRYLAIITLCLAAACSVDEHSPDAELDQDVELRGLPEAVQIHVEVESPSVAPSLFDCFLQGPDEQPAWIDYSDGNGTVEQKDIEICVRSSGSKQSSECWRDALLKLGGEVQP